MANVYNLTIRVSIYLKIVQKWTDEHRLPKTGNIPFLKLRQTFPV